MKIYLHGIIILLAFMCTSALRAQKQETPKEFSITEFGLGLGYNVVAGDYADRYGNHMNFGLIGQHVTKKNWIVNAELQYFFTENLKEDVLAPYRSNGGYLLGDDNQYVSVIAGLRGLYLGAGIGKLFPISSKSRSGLKIVVSGGVFQHKIVFSNERNAAVQIRAGREVGYDRLTRGFGTKETIAYKHVSDDKRLNFEIGIDMIQGFTSEVRAINFDTGLPTIKDRLDLTFGIRATWFLPFYSQMETTKYY